tara:strand:+ start:655 stop:1278 length:624 start_codon:yes stop_codon:yes gene_type:complete
MFTGIIQALGKIQSIDISGEKGRIIISSPLEFRDYDLGESIAVNGVCLTVVNFTATNFSVDISTETLRRTSFEKLKISHKVNLERSITPMQKMSGHFVMGHVDGLSRVDFIEYNKGETLIRFTHPPELSAYLVEKGSVAIDGISLTVFDCKDYKFTVSIIPFTLSHTNLHERKIDDSVNLECDMIGKYIYKACENILGNTGDHRRNS